MNMFKKNGGFTLVELIVVIAILAILAGVAVPAYSGYISKANDAACGSELAAIQTAAQSACAMEGVALEKITITVGHAAAIAVTPADAQDAFEDFYTANASVVSGLLAKHSSKPNTVTWNDGVAAEGATEVAGWDILAE